MKENDEINIINMAKIQIDEKEKKEICNSEIDLQFKKYQNMIENNNKMNLQDILKYLNIIYIALRKDYLRYREIASSILDVIINKLNWDQHEFSLFKDYILEHSMLFFILLKLYIRSDNTQSIHELLTKILKSLLIGNVEMIQVLFNLFPKSLFENIQIDPKPFNWINEWDDFLQNINKNYSESKLIWNEECRDELSKYLEKILKEFDKVIFSKKIDEDNKNEKENNLNKMNICEKSSKPLKEFEKESFFEINNNSVDYLNYKMDYITLKNEVFVWKYYLKKLIKEEQGNPSFIVEIEKPKKLWKQIKLEICLENKPERIILMLKVLILLYKNYNSNKRKYRKDFKPIGKFEDYDFFLNLFQKFEGIEIKSYIIQLLYISVSHVEQKSENRKQLLNKKDIGTLILSFIQLLESSIKDDSYSINFDIEEVSKKPYNNFYIDKEKEELKFFKDIESKYSIINNGSFYNYSNYYPVDEENWKNCNNKYKLLCIVCSLFHNLEKQLKRNNKENKNDLPIFPIPGLTKVLKNTDNYISILKLLLYDNNNLSFQALNLFMYYLLDLLNESIGNDFCILDILFILMIKYKSFKILKSIEKISSSYIKRNKSKVYEDLKLSEEEKEFFDHYSSLEKQKFPPIKYKKPIILLIRYFPLQIIFFLMSNKLEDFFKLIYTEEDINTYKIIWNRKMLDDLLKSIRKIVLNHKNKLELNKEFRYDYSELNRKEKNFFIYYIKNDCEDVLKNINEDFYPTMINILCFEKYLVDLNYIKLLYIIIEKSIQTLTKELKEKIKEKVSLHIYPYNNVGLVDNDNINKTEFDLEVLKYYLKILSLIDENENNILKYNNNINLTINKILSLDNKLSFKAEDNNTRILLVLLNYLLEQPKIKKLLDIIENEKEKEDIDNDVKDDKNNIVNNEKEMIINQNEYDNISKIVQQISRYTDTLFEVNQTLFIAFLKYFTFLCEKDKNIINYINMTIFPLQLLRLCTKYKLLKVTEKDIKNNIYFVIFRTLKTMLKNSQFLNEIMEKLLANKRLMTIFLGNGTTFLKELTQGHLRPKSIWSKKDLESLIKFLDKTIDEQKNVSDVYSKIRESEKKEINNELKIGNIYIKIYNANPKQRQCIEENEKQGFLTKLVKEFIKQENLNDLKHILWSICNVINYQQLDIKFLLSLSFNELLNKFYTYAYHITHLNEEEKKENLKNEESDIQIYEIKDTCPKSERSANICLQFIEIISKNDSTIFNLQETEMIYIFIILIEFSNYKGSLEIINEILNKIFNYYMKKNQKETNKLARTKIINPEGDLLNFSFEKYQGNREKKIKSIFLFLFKKLLFFSQNKKNIPKENNSQYMELFYIISVFFNSKALDLSLRELYKYYIPAKMIDNLFHAISPDQRNDEKAIQKLFNDWLKDKIEFPDLKWNVNSFNRSYKLLCDDCQMILNDKSLIDNFENIYIETDRITENKFFFENPDEYKIDNIYLRLFNKEPNYNIGHNLPIFLLHIIDSMLDHIYDYYIYCYTNNPNLDLDLLEKLKNFKEKCLITSLTSIMLIIEQINFNNKNPNLILSTDKELNIQLTKKEVFRKDILQLVKNSFDYQKLLSEDNSIDLIQLQKIIFYYEYEEKKKSYKIFFNAEIRIIYLQILYLIASNEYSIEYLSEYFEENIILDFYFNLLKCEEKLEIPILDYEYILVCGLINKLISIDISHIPIILAEYLDNFWNLSIKRPNIKKYIQILFKNIELDSQYGDSLVKLKDKYNFSFDEKLSINKNKIWRLECSEKKDIKYDKKNIHYCNYNDLIERNNKGEFKDYEFPIILDKSINYFKYDEYNDDLFDLEVKKIKDYEKSQKNEAFIKMKDLLDQIQNL